MSKKIIFIVTVLFILIGSRYIPSQKIIPTATSTPTPSIFTNLNSENIMDKVDEKYDQFGIEKLYPDLPGGREWFANWHNGSARTLKSGQRDQYDNELIARGNGVVKLIGNGTVIISGDSPRMYVYDKDKKKKWNNVEVTVYAKRVSETESIASQGFVIGARSEHQDANEQNPCLGKTYYGRVLYDGRAVFQKEVIHEGAYSVNMPSENNKAHWKTVDGTLPKNIWIGVKFIVQTSRDKKSVKLQLFRDMTDGLNGGKWEKLAEYVDIGSWSQTDTYANVKDKCGYGAGKLLVDPGTSVFIRNDLVGDVEYKKFNIREIE